MQVQKSANSFVLPRFLFSEVILPLCNGYVNIKYSDNAIFHILFTFLFFCDIL